jgi:hypothetical protein
MDTLAESEETIGSAFIISISVSPGKPFSFVAKIIERIIGGQSLMELATKKWDAAFQSNIFVPTEEKLAN